MAKFRKKPVVIEAVQLTWGTWNEVCDFVPKPWFVRGCYIDAAGNETAGGDGRMGLVMTTLESKHHIAKEGDWIIKGVKGEFYSCDAEVFAADLRPGGIMTQRVGTCSICGGDVMGFRGAWYSILPPPPETCSLCGAVAGSDVIKMTPRPGGPSAPTYRTYTTSDTQEPE